MAEDPSAAGDVDSSPKKIKVTAVGDSGVGKTCMLMTFANDEFPTDGRIPSLYEGGTIKGKVHQAAGPSFKMITLELWLVNTNSFILWCKTLWWCMHITGEMSRFQ